MDHALCVYGAIEREMKPQMVSGGNHMADMLVKLPESVKLKYFEP